ncbi:MAG: CHASE2 domain-containing protein, partial [Hyphomicrobiaceae bacterium]
YRPETSKDETPRESFSRLLSEADGERPQIPSRLISWLQPFTKSGAQVFPTISVEPHAPGSKADALLPPGWKAVVKDRIVLMGGDFIDRDGHLTPFSVLDGERTPGVMIHAQMVAQIRDQRSVKQLSFEHEAIALVLIAIFGGVLSTIFHLRTDSLTLWLVGVTGIVVAGLISFGTLRLIIPSSTLFLAWMGGIWGHQVITYLERKTLG